MPEGGGLKWKFTVNMLELFLVKILFALSTE